jgi:hypothetical protein
MQRLGHDVVFVYNLLLQLEMRELRVQVLVVQTWQCGDRRNGEIRAHVMSEKQYLRVPEWLGRSRMRSSMTSG